MRTVRKDKVVLMEQPVYVLSEVVTEECLSEESHRARQVLFIARGVTRTVFKSPLQRLDPREELFSVPTFLLPFGSACAHEFPHHILPCQFLGLDLLLQLEHRVFQSMTPALKKLRVLITGLGVDLMQSIFS
mmetsp:Transcript_72421/g.170334  ORF Transcript_72421/g.170334 Transcript_72421/m.170334 type:complete len:132 (-) Transcript_72421:246-641(-)